MISIFINGLDTPYQSLKLHVSSINLISSIQLELANEIDYIIDDIIVVKINNTSQFIKLKISKVKLIISSTSQYKLVVATSYENELERFYTPYTKQFESNCYIFDILNEYGFDVIGDNFKLEIEDFLTIPIGTKIINTIANLLFAHGYVFVPTKEYQLKISKINNTNKSITINNFENLEYTINQTYEDVILYSDNNLSIIDNWRYINTPTTVKNALGVQIDNQYNQKGLKGYYDTFIERFKRSKYSLNLEVSNVLAVYPNTKIIINNLPASINKNISYFVDDIVYEIDNNKSSMQIKLKGIDNV